MRHLLARIPLALILILLAAPASVEALFVYGEDTIPEAEEGVAEVHVLGRDSCSYCQKEKAFIRDIEGRYQDEVRFIYYDIARNERAAEIFSEVAQANDLPQSTPITLVGGRVIQGFGSAETTGSLILGLATSTQAHYPLSHYLEKQETVGGDNVCGPAQAAGECIIEEQENTTPAGDVISRIDVPFFGAVDVSQFSLFGLSAVLGLVDGFNPCAMWVLVTFLLILLQIGDRKKMWYVAGLFILAEGVMYYLILNVWYTTWDFIELDRIVTPLVGALALAGGGYFLWKYYKNRGTLTCDVTDIEHQKGIEAKMYRLVSSPFTLATVAGIIAIAFSVNVIEFACSVGIPQAFTKILELNELTGLGHLWYMLVYIVMYMADDLVVFALALYGINKLHGSYKYASLSSLIGGILMVLLGVVLIFFPDLLVW